MDVSAELGNHHHSQLQNVSVTSSEDPPPPLLAFTLLSSPLAKKYNTKQASRYVCIKKKYLKNNDLT